MEEVAQKTPGRERPGEGEEKKLIEKTVTSTEDSVTIGESTFPLSELVDNPKKYGNLVVDIVTNDEWVERRMQQMRPHFDPFIQVQDMEEWDRQNLDRYPPTYAPLFLSCGLCGVHPCDLGGGRKGSCGLTPEKAISLRGLQQACTGAGQFIHQARLLYDYLISHLDPSARIDLGYQIYYRCPNIMMVTGTYPEHLSELEPVLSYLERELAEAVAACSPATPLTPQDLEGRTFQLGMLSFVAMEVSELINMCAMDHNCAGRLDIVALQKWPPPTTPTGVGGVDRTRFVLLFVGTADIIGWEVVKRVKAEGLEEKVELCGVGDAGLKLSRIYDGARVLGIGAHLLKFLRLGIPDLILYDGGCVPVDLLAEARKLEVPVILPSKLAFSFLPNLTRCSPEEIVAHFREHPAAAACIVDYPKAAQAALALREVLPRSRKGLTFVQGDLQELSKAYGDRQELDLSCPAELELAEAFEAAGQGDIEGFRRRVKGCTFCGRCEAHTTGKASPLELILKGSEAELQAERAHMRAGRGPVTHVEYRDAAFSVWAACPGFITLTGCAATPNAVEEIAWLAEEYASIGFIVYLSGCAAIAAGQVKDAQGKTVYERHYGTFQIRGVVNTGECSTNCHCLGGDTKLSVIAGRVPYRANYIEIADYLLNRWGSTVVIWGATSEKLFAMASGWARIGIPALIGPASQELMDRFLLGDGKDSSRWWLYDILRGKKVYVEPGKSHLIAPVSTKEEALNVAARLMMSPCDITPARETRIMHYVDTYQPLEKGLPEDWHHFCRGITELPTRLKFKLLRDLDRKGWEVDVKKGKIIRFRRPDGEMVDSKEFFERHRIPHGVSGARVPKLILKEQTRFSEEGTFA